MARYKIKMLDGDSRLAPLSREIEKLYMSGELPGVNHAINITKPDNTNVEFGHSPIPGFNVRVFVVSIEHRYQIDSRGIPMEDMADVYASWYHSR